jgi:MATE family multidrug resistance protein
MAPTPHIADTAAAGQPSGWREELTASFALAWPLALANLAQIAITTTDTIMIGWLGARELAGVTLGTVIYVPCLIFGMGMMTAVSPMMAQALGRSRHAVRDIRRTARQGLWLATFFAIVSWLLLSQVGPLLSALGQEPGLTYIAVDYIAILKWTVLPAVWFVVLRFFISALERPRAALVVTVLAIFLNAFGNWVLIFGNLGAPAMGVTGAAVVSVVANTFMAGCLVGFVLLDRRLRRWYIFGRFWRSDWPRFLELIRLGLPIGLLFGLDVAAFAAAVMMIGYFGTEALAAHAVAARIASITFMIAMGIAQAATVRVGRATGRGDMEAARRAGWVAIAMGAVVMVCTGLFLLSFPDMLARAFLDAAQPVGAATMVVVRDLLLIAAIFQIVDGTQVVAAGALRGLKDTRMPMVYAVIGFFGIGLPVGASLAFVGGLGVFGTWLGLASGLGAVAVMLTMRWKRFTSGMTRSAQVEAVAS